MNSNPDQSKSTFISLEINDEPSESSIMISESFSKSFELLKIQLNRMAGDLDLLKFEAKKLGTRQDSHSLRESINKKLMKMSREIDITGNDIKSLAQQTFSNGEKSRLKQLALEYSKLLDDIEETDKYVMNECKSFIKDAKIKVNQDLSDKDTISKNENIPLIANAQAMLIPGLKEEIEYNEQLIDEREAEILNISRASNLINELFQQIGVLTGEQQDLVDNIEANAEFARETTKKAVKHLDKTHRQQQAKTSRMCFYFIFIIIAATFIFTILVSML